MKQNAENDFEEANSLIFETPMENPEERIIRFFQMWDWQGAKLNLWNMCKRANGHPDYETQAERDDLILYVETLMELMKACYTLQKKWQERRTE